jgi:hypothetical protein
MSPKAHSPQWRSPPQIADLLRIEAEKVIAWIKSGQLIAVNVGNGPLRPRYRISQESLDDFLRRRQTQPPAPRPVRRRKQTSVREYF